MCDLCILVSKTLNYAISCILHEHSRSTDCRGNLGIAEKSAWYAPVALIYVDDALVMCYAIAMGSIPLDDALTLRKHFILGGKGGVQRNLQSWGAIGELGASGGVVLDNGRIQVK